ncbi:bifunctional 3-deoxy-7-phosphoheptulonate synthase/chorismate mutase type II [Mesonia ostreae]|uniref:chorismate mutase n=1 Tax=Mesonia ostreae TaxID=861110 RepID=A0ABU2KFA1_9FLAO|nr:bifunctional 3-deoxy-7-phosphoheptulonate synthase/chorismate mutase type II [Mesonia ostreae]MDT0293390.1 bifunctional 3-deoxy-7-phosphoheptulonate synthase/chorismate mutase type II [Mesonia ostreae]
MENSPQLRGWLDQFNLDHPLVIAGPCSAETEEQVLKTAHQLKDTDTSVLRAGIWKPRTRPGNFEGVGALGLKWLQKAKEETGLMTTTEVANPIHVDLALKHDVDILWIGARTTVSPFMIQEIAEALKGTEKTVLIKNPVNPDLALWLGAVERFYKQGVKNLGVIHRGFSTYNKSVYRNIPEWQIPIDLQNEFPDLPLILDPSHIAGKRNLIFELCQTALDLNYDGIMVETHYNPDKAWSDAKQQITPNTLIELTENLRVRNKVSSDEDFNYQLNKLRAKIDKMDEQLIDVLGERMLIADAIGKVKKEHNVAILQPERWQKVLRRMIQLGNENGFEEEFILQIYKAIHQESIARQQKVLND